MVYPPCLLMLIFPKYPSNFNWKSIRYNRVCAYQIGFLEIITGDIFCDLSEQSIVHYASDFALQGGKQRVGNWFCFKNLNYYTSDSIKELELRHYCYYLHLWKFGPFSITYTPRISRCIIVIFKTSVSRLGSGIKTDPVSRYRLLVGCQGNKRERKKKRKMSGAKSAELTGQRGRLFWSVSGLQSYYYIVIFRFFSGFLFFGAGKRENGA